jgi:hypothetical protein
MIVFEGNWYLFFLKLGLSPVLSFPGVPTLMTGRPRAIGLHLNFR